MYMYQTHKNKYQSNGYVNKIPKKESNFSNLSFNYLNLFMQRKEIRRNINSIGCVCHAKIIFLRIAENKKLSLSWK